MILLAAALLLLPSPLLAWGEQGHNIIADSAARSMPNAMPAFFHRQHGRLIYLSADPDRTREAGPSINSANFPEHQLDYEYVAALELPPRRHEYLRLVVESGVLRRNNLRLEEPGLLPWKIAELCEELEGQWRRYFQRTDRMELEAIEHSIIQLSGELAHYVGDAGQPHHTTMNYNGWVLPNPNGYANDCDIHSRFETRFISHNFDTTHVLPLVAPMKQRREYFNEAVALMKESFLLVEELYRIDLGGGFENNGTAEGHEFALQRLSRSASVLRDLWWATYLNAQQPRARR